MDSQEMLLELVRDFKLETTFEDDLRITMYTTPWGRNIASRREIWVRDKILGHGGYGLVWLQRNANANETPGTPKLRAVKEIRLYKPKSGGMDYVRELEALAKFSHNRYAEFFVKSYGWYEGPESLFITMEYCEHGDLGGYLYQQEKLPENQAHDIALQVLGGLSAMHEQGFAHRDLKPANILIKSRPPGDWWVKICDLGLTKRIKGAVGSTTVRGTPGFIPPEMTGLDGNPRTANLLFADMWCFGETVFQMLTGIPTFWNLSSLQKYQLGHTEFPVQALARVTASDAAIDFICSIMTPNPSARLTAAAALQHAWTKPALEEQPDPIEFILLQRDARSNSDVSSSAQPTQSYAAWSTTEHPIPTHGLSPYKSDDQNTAKLPSAVLEQGLTHLPATSGSSRIQPSISNSTGGSSKENTHLGLPSFSQPSLNGDHWLPRGTTQQSAASTDPSDDEEVTDDLVKDFSNLHHHNEVVVRESQNVSCSESESRHLEEVKVLLEKGVDINSPGKDGRTPLYAASRLGHIAVVTLLLENGADISVPIEGEWTPLHPASNYGHIEVVQLLLEEGAEAAATNSQGWTPLHGASNYGCIEVVKLLLEKGAKVDISNEGWVPLHCASEHGHIEIVKLLLEKGSEVAATTKERWTPLHLASANGHTELAKQLLEKGAEVEAITHKGWAPLHVASDHGHIEVVRLLLGKGAKVHVLSEKRWTPLHMASLKGYTEITKQLLENGAEVDAVTNRGCTPLHFATSYSHVGVVKLLLEQGAEINLADNSSRTPLMIASQHGHSTIVGLLYKKTPSRQGLGRTIQVDKKGKNASGPIDKLFGRIFR